MEDHIKGHHLGEGRRIVAGIGVTECRTRPVSASMTRVAYLGGGGCRGQGGGSQGDGGYTQATGQDRPQGAPSAIFRHSLQFSPHWNFGAIPDT